METWKRINGYPNYEVSNLGNVKNSRGRIMKQRTTPRGYKEIGLRRAEDGQSFFLVHRLVANAFVSNADEKPQVNHIDGNPLNNQSSNLEWVTQSENQLHAYETGLQEVTDDQVNRLRGFAKGRRKPVRVVNKKLGIDEVFNSIAEASRNVDCNEKTLRNVLKGRNKSRLGYEVTYL